MLFDINTTHQPYQ